MLEGHLRRGIDIIINIALKCPDNNFYIIGGSNKRYPTGKKLTKNVHF